MNGRIFFGLNKMEHKEIEIDLRCLAGLSLCDVIVNLSECSVSHNSIKFTVDQAMTLAMMAVAAANDNLEEDSTATTDGCCFTFHVYRIRGSKYKICYHEKESHQH